MCGIYGHVGINAVNEVMQGIKRLEYRGYDSAGIAFVGRLTDKDEYHQNVFQYEQLKVVKEKGQVDKLVKVVEELNAEGEIAVGHTRWATHGEPNILNSHPHISENGRWAVVHNGIIENYLELKNMLVDYHFKSDTDTEIISALLQKHFKGDTLFTLKKVCSLLKGSFALAIVYYGEPNKIYVARQNSPVVVGKGENFGVVCSDINSLSSVEEAFVLENGQFAIVEKEGLKIYDKDLNQCQIPSIDTLEIEENMLGEFQHFMRKEIEEIPLAIEKTICQYNSCAKFDACLSKEVVKDIQEIILIACGTAYHASLMGKNILERDCGIRATALVASEFIADEFLWNKNTLAIFVSQSGETADTLKALKICKEKGLKTLAITNVKNSSICYEADFLIYTCAGKEVAVASTKAYNSQVAIFHMLGAYLNVVKNQKEENSIFEEYKNLCLVCSTIDVKKIEPLCKEISYQIKDSKSIYMIGRGNDFRTALESSLKLKEISYIHCEAYPAGELKHGTISLITPQTYIFAFSNEIKTKDKAMANIQEVVSRGGKVILLTSFDDIEREKRGDKFYKIIKLPKVEEKYLPLVAVVYMQLIAYHTSLSLGINPDKPRSLAKSVTVE